MRIIYALFLITIFLFACEENGEQKTNSSSQERVSAQDDLLELEESVTLTPPRTNTPPPPPTIEEIPEEELEFLDQTVDEETLFETKANVAPPTSATRKNAPSQIPKSEEDYHDLIKENEFKSALNDPLSTFSIDVDNASYSNCRSYLERGSFPPAQAVRIEEFINYFNYDYAKPKGNRPFSVQTELSNCPWAAGHKLVHIGIQGKQIDRSNLPPSNLVFLIDVSGSMNDWNKLPLLKKAFKLLSQQVRSEDRVAIVVYAGASGIVLPSTPGNQKRQIFEALDRLQAGGGTAGAAGIELAYQVAAANFIKEGNNRVILATDGDFNVGASSENQLKTLIEKQRDAGVFLSTLGFGMGNYQDRKMELLADHGNGNYAYIDNLQEARKVLVEDMTGTIFTIAKDVKIQIEFNPTKVKSYRLIGYENRKLANKDFNDDKKDAGELGAGHTVTALYEIIPADGYETLTSDVDALKYQKRNVTQSAKGDPDWMTIKLRYKHPKEAESQLIVTTCRDSGNDWSESSENFRFSAAVAGFGMILRNSEYKGTLNYALIEEWIKESKGVDKFAYRADLLQLVRLASSLEKQRLIEEE